MKVNTKVFNSLTRDPDIRQVVGVTEKVKINGKKTNERVEKPFNIYYANATEKQAYFNEDFFYILSTNGNEYRLLIDRDGYFYGCNKEYFSESMNSFRVHLLKKLIYIQRISLFAIMLPITIIFLIGLSLVFGFRGSMKNTSNATWIIVMMLVAMFIATFITTKQTRQKMTKYTKQLDLRLESEIGLTQANEVYKSISNYTKELIKQREIERKAALERKAEEKKQKQNKK